MTVWDTSPPSSLSPDFLNKVTIPCSSFPCGSDGKASAYNAGDPGSIPGREVPLEKEMATHSSSLAWKIPWMEATVHEVAKSQTRLSDFTSFLALAPCVLIYWPVVWQVV